MAKTQTEWIISLDDDLEDCDELFVGHVRDGDRLTRCKNCHWHYGTICRRNNTMFWEDEDFCSLAERK